MIVKYDYGLRDKLDIVLNRFAGSFPFKQMHDRFVPATPAQTMERLLDSDVRYEINLDEYIQVYDLDLEVPSEIEIAIGWLKNKKNFGYAFARTYYNAKSALLRVNINDYKDNALREMLFTARAALEATADPDTVANPADHFDMDRD